jgi:hypothetical protein
MATRIGYKVDIVNTPEQAYALIEQADKSPSPFSIAIVDMRFEEGGYDISLGKDVINVIKENYPYIACILSSGEIFSPADVLDLRDYYYLDYYLPKTDLERDALSYALRRSLEVNNALKELRLKNSAGTIESKFAKDNKKMSGDNFAAEKQKKNSPRIPKVFISYSHKDEDFKNELVTMLAGLQRRKIIDAWQDCSIEPGDEWFLSIQNAINDSDMALFLVSSDFLASEFIADQEIPQLLSRRKENGLRAVPIIVRECLWKTEPVLKDLQALPKGGKPIITFKRDTGERDQAWTEIATALEGFAKIFMNPS